MRGGQCPICEYHGFESHLKIVFWNQSKSYMKALCSKINHCLIKTDGSFVPENSDDYKRFVTVYWKGKWRTYDKYDFSFYNQDYFVELERKQQAMLNRQIFTSQITWLLCSTRLGVQKDVTRIIARMIDSAPYAPVYTEGEQINMFRLLLNWCNWCNHKKQLKNE